MKYFICFQKKKKKNLSEEYTTIDDSQSYHSLSTIFNNLSSTNFINESSRLCVESTMIYAKQKSSLSYSGRSSTIRDVPNPNTARTVVFE
jgi:hypothetical protein